MRSRSSIKKDDKYFIVENKTEKNVDQSLDDMFENISIKQDIKKETSGTVIH
jgi:hypothetical protein